MPANSQAQIKLRSLEEIPQPYRAIFSEYPCLNRVQSTVFDDIFHSTSSVIVTAPTGSGKTLLFELAFIKLLIESPKNTLTKAVYVAPVKALCNERFSDWNARFGHLGISCVKITGDSDDHTLIDEYQLIITTPEKWDILTRKWRENVSIIQSVKLVMIDEVHLLRDPRRGPVLETIVCRMKTMVRVLKLESHLRFIAVSATILNIEDLADWLSNEQPARFHRFDNETRPVKLQRFVKGFLQKKGQSPFLFDIQLSYKLKPILLEHTHGKPALIFCSTRRGVEQTCKVLSEQLSFQFSSEQNRVLQELSSRLTDGKLKMYVLDGLAFHHAGMTAEDRVLIQDIFMNGSLPILVSTSTLAMGVNLPAHLVIIKSTFQYIAGRTVEYPESTVLQMVGRAGRPQFDTTATAVIMTRFENVHRYENMLDCKEVLESSLHLQLAEHLNSEIVLHTISDLSVAMEWIRCTFLYVRALKNPQFYGCCASAESHSKVEKHLEAMVLREINALHRAGLVCLDENGIDVTPTADGKLMSHYYINFQTFLLFHETKPTATLPDLLKLLSEANELNEVQLRVNERRFLNELNINKLKEVIRFTLPGKIMTSCLKVNCLAQACLGCLTIPDPSLQQESQRIVHVLERVSKCLVEYLSRKGNYCSYLSAVILAKCFRARLWENTLLVGKQLDRIGVTLGSALVACGKTSFQSLAESHPQELERIVKRGPPMGHMIIDQIRHLPQYSLHIDVVLEKQRCRVSVNVGLVNASALSVRSTAGNRHSFFLIIGDSNNKLIHQRRIQDKTLIQSSMAVNVSLVNPFPKSLFVHIISEDWAGLDVVRDVTINPLVSSIVGLNCHLPSSQQVAKKAKKRKAECRSQSELNVSKKLDKSTDLESSFREEESILTEDVSSNLNSSFNKSINEQKSSNNVSKSEIMNRWLQGYKKNSNPAHNQQETTHLQTIENSKPVDWKNDTTTNDWAKDFDGERVAENPSFTSDTCNIKKSCSSANRSFPSHQYGKFVVEQPKKLQNPVGSLSSFVDVELVNQKENGGTRTEQNMVENGFTHWNRDNVDNGQLGISSNARSKTQFFKNGVRSVDTAIINLPEKVRPNQHNLEKETHCQNLGSPLLTSNFDLAENMHRIRSDEHSSFRSHDQPFRNGNESFNVTMSSPSHGCNEVQHKNELNLYGNNFKPRDCENRREMVDYPGWSKNNGNSPIIRQYSNQLKEPENFGRRADDLQSLTGFEEKGAIMNLRYQFEANGLTFFEHQRRDDAMELEIKRLKNPDQRNAYIFSPRYHVPEDESPPFEPDFLTYSPIDDNSTDSPLRENLPPSCKVIQQYEDELIEDNASDLVLQEVPTVRNGMEEDYQHNEASTCNESKSDETSFKLPQTNRQSRYKKFSKSSQNNSLQENHLQQSNASQYPQARSSVSFLMNDDLMNKNEGPTTANNSINPPSTNNAFVQNNLSHQTNIERLKNSAQNPLAVFRTNKTMPLSAIENVQSCSVSKTNHRDNNAVNFDLCPELIDTFQEESLPIIRQNSTTSKSCLFNFSNYLGRSYGTDSNRLENCLLFLKSELSKRQLKEKIMS